MTNLIKRIRKGLGVGLISLLATTSMAGPLELNKSLTDNLRSNGLINCEDGRIALVHKTIPSKKEYNLEIQANNVQTYDGKTTERNLGFAIKDSDTQIEIRDSNADGLSKRDSFSLQHKFHNGARLYLDIRYLGEDNYHILSRILRDSQGYEEFDVETANLNPLLKWIANKKIKPIIDLGQKLYLGLVDSALSGQQPELPYKEVKSALNDVESYLTATNLSSGDLESGLLKLGKKYQKIIEQRESYANSTKITTGGLK